MVPARAPMPKYSWRVREARNKRTFSRVLGVLSVLLALCAALLPAMATVETLTGTLGLQLNEDVVVVTTAIVASVALVLAAVAILRPWSAVSAWAVWAMALSIAVVIGLATFVILVFDFAR